MKTINNYRYILFAIMILGFFASFAQNEYGWTMIVYCNLLMGLLTAIEFGKHENAVWKQNKSGIILSALFCICIILFFAMVMLLKDELFETIAPYLGFSILGILVLEIILVIIGNRKTVELTSRSLALESLGLVIILFSSFCKFNHLPGSNALFILGNLILFPLYFSRGIINFFKEYKKGK